MLKTLRKCLALASLATASLVAHADEVTFLFGADPQYEFYERDVKNTRTVRP